MSQRSRRRNRVIDDDDDDDNDYEDYEMRPPRASQNIKRQNPRASQAGPSTRDDYDDSVMPDSSQTSKTRKIVIPEDEEKHLITSVIKYLLVADHAKTVIQRANIVEHAMAGHGKYFKHIMAKVQETMRKIFGYNLVELEGNKYILTNNISNDRLHLQFSKQEKIQLVLLFIVLGHIFMTDESGCREEELFDLLRNLDIIEENNFMHEYFGDVKYLITDKFIKQGYLERVNVDKSDPPLQHYQWGPRAENELTPRNILEFMSKIFGGRPLNTWPAQFKLMQMREDLNISL